jgi:hypothetical protein
MSKQGEQELVRAPSPSRGHKQACVLSTHSSNSRHTGLLQLTTPIDKRTLQSHVDKHTREKNWHTPRMPLAEYDSWHNHMSTCCKDHDLCTESSAALATYPAALATYPYKAKQGTQR